jgi:hypothetical protein
VDAELLMGDSGDVYHLNFAYAVVMAAPRMAGLEQVE